jgi:hypothetical protein
MAGCRRRTAHDRQAAVQPDLILRHASALLFGDRPAVNLPSEEIPSLIAVLQAQRVPIATLASASVLASLDAAAGYVAEEAKRYDRQRCAVQEVADAWASDGIEAVLIKSPGYFPYTSSNVDVVVPSRSARTAARVLERLGYRELPSMREPHKRLFRRMRQPHLGFPVHLHTAVAWINRFLTDVEVLRGRRRLEAIAGLSYPSAENVFSITTAHWLYEDKELTLRDLHHANLAVADGVDWGAVRRRAARAGWGSGLELALGVYQIAAERFGARRLLEQLPSPRVRANLLRRELAQLERRAPAAIRLSRPLCKALQLAKTARDHELAKGEASREALRIVSYAARAQLPSSRRGPFVLVSVSGPDGVGKTTLAHALQGFLEREVGLPVAYHWTRLGSSPFLDLIRALASEALDSAARLRGDPAAGVTARVVDRSVLAERPLALRAWGCVLAAELLARLWARHARCRMAGGIHIFDRHAIDGVADLEDVYAVAAARWLARLAPHPDVRILFRTGGPGAVVYAPYEAVADALLTPRDSIDVLVERAAGEVLKPYVRTRERT